MTSTLTPTPSNESINDNKENGDSPPEGPSTSKSSIPLDKHVFQTIFLDNSPVSSALWSKDEIDPRKVGLVHGLNVRFRLEIHDINFTGDCAEMVEAAEPSMAALRGDCALDGAD
jgi:hypothetical protein